MLTSADSHRFAIASCTLVVLLACAGTTHADGRDSRWKEQAVPGLPAKGEGQAFRKGVVATANPHAAEAGAQILESGGNAVDAAVAIAYALNVVEPQSAGIGGGGFMMVHLARSGRTFTIDTRERAPAGSTPGMFSGLSFTQASTSGIAVGVPGMVRGTADAVRRWGRLPLARVLQPAIRLADDGFAATPRFVASPACASATSRAKVYPETAEYFCPGGLPIAAGALVTNKPLAQTLRTIAREGPDAFYSGEIARGIIEGQKRMSAGGKPGTMTLADLQAYEATTRDPVVSSYRGYLIKGMGPPSSGALTIGQMLKMIERFPIGDARAGFGFGSPATLNVMAEVMRTAFADRALWMGDADFSYVPVKGLLNPTYTAMRSEPIAPTARLMVNPVAGDPRPYDIGAWTPGTRHAGLASFAGPGGSTTHFSVADKWGNLVSYTNTIESGYGAGMFAGYYPDGCTQISCFKSFGFLLNNELTDFNFTPSLNPFTGEAAANDVAPGKRPRSSMAPSMIFDRKGRPLVAYGSPGGSTIINSVFNVTLNLLDHGMTLQQAIDAPRLSVTAAGGSVSIDTGNPLSPTPFPAASLDALRVLGHTVNAPADIGSVQIVVIDPRTGKQYGGADSRREGTVIGLPRPRHGHHGQDRDDKDVDDDDADD
ncbi:gamma-glutamyltransferase [Variovorax sp. YR752]|uniref:gamma-glutamyltransferase n=1 Tax=Variovorax sp. YR752 TaxID=1884383 RepID=UPI0031382DD0